MPDGFPPTVYVTYLLQPWVKEHLGAKVDYVEFSSLVDMGKLPVWTGHTEISSAPFSTDGSCSQRFQ